MTTQEFEQKIQAISPKFSIKPNLNRPGLNNIFFDGKNYDLPVVADDVREEVDTGYTYEFPNGYAPRMWTQGEIEEKLKTFLTQFTNGELKEDYE